MTSKFLQTPPHLLDVSLQHGLGGLTTPISAHLLRGHLGCPFKHMQHRHDPKHRNCFAWGIADPQPSRERGPPTLGATLRTTALVPCATEQRGARGGAPAHLTSCVPWPPPSHAGNQEQGRGGRLAGRAPVRRGSEGCQVPRFSSQSLAFAYQITEEDEQIVGHILLCKIILIIFNS